MTLSFVILIALLLAFGLRIAHGQTQTTVAMSGDSDQIKFSMTPPGNLMVTWGVYGRVAQTETINLTSGQATVEPITGTVSIQIPNSYIVSTNFVKLNNEDWYAIPRAQHVVKLEGDSDKITITEQFSRTIPLTIAWGVSSQPEQIQTLSFTPSSRTVTITPPVNTVSLQIRSDVSVSTTFVSLAPGNWFAVPPALHELEIAGSTREITFTKKFVSTQPINIMWGVSSRPPVTQTLAFSGTQAIVVPPTGVVSLVITSPGIQVKTAFKSLGNGWYEVPSIPPVNLERRVYLPYIIR
jgi:hypothetical protein